ncbi:hypothetical protein [Streptomyces sp. NPDC051576]
MTTSNGRQGTRRPGEKAQSAGAGRRAEDRPAATVRVVPLWEGLSQGVRG